MTNIFKDSPGPLLLGCVALLSLSSVACGDAPDELDNPTTTTTGTKRLCIGQVVAEGTSTQGQQESFRVGYPSAAWTETAGALAYDNDKLETQIGGRASELCGMPASSTMSKEEFKAAVATFGGAPCFCGVGADVDSKTSCDDECEGMLAANPAFSGAPGTYSCSNEDDLFGSGLPAYARDVGIACEVPPSTMRSTQSLPSGSGGLTQFMAFANYHLRAADGRVNSDGIGVIQYSADVSDSCVDGCEIVINRISISFNDSSYDRWAFTRTFALSQGIIRGSVDADGRISIGAGAGKFVVQFDSNGKTGNFVDSNRAPISGTFDGQTGALSLSSIVVEDGDLSVDLSLTDAEVFASPPRPSFGPTGVMECNARFGREVQLSSAGSFDVDGDLARFHWVRNDEIVEFGPTTTVFFGLGSNEVALNAFDARGALNFKRDTITVVDTTAPAWGVAPLVDLTSCDTFVDRHTLTPPPVSDICTDVASITAHIVESDGVVRSPALPIDYANALLPGGDHVVEWVATDSYGNHSAVRQQVRLGPAILATNKLSVRDRSRVINQAGALAAVGSTGTQVTQLGVLSRLQEVLSFGPIFMQNDAQVIGRAASKGSIQRQPGASAGVLQPFSTVPLGAIPWLAPYTGTLFGSGSTSVEPNQTLPLGNGAHGAITVKSRATLLITGNALSFQRLELEPLSTVIVQQSGAQLVVKERFVQRGVWRGAGWVRLVVLGDEALFEAPVSGMDIIAPQARLPIATGASGMTVRQLVGRDLEVHPDVTLKCDRTSLLQ